MHIRARTTTRTSLLAAAGCLGLSLMVIAPAEAQAATSATSSTSAASAATTSVRPPAGTPRLSLGVDFGVTVPPVHVVVGTAGRYVVEYDGTGLPAALNTSIDYNARTGQGKRLPQVGVAGTDVVYTVPFTLTKGAHQIGLGGPEMYGPVNAYLVGPF